MAPDAAPHHSMEREAAAAAVEDDLAQACGAFNAAAARLVSVLARALETKAHEGAGIHSPEQWVAWKCGLSRGRAHKLVSMARRLGELPQAALAFSAGQVSEDQVAVVCRHAPAYADAEVTTLARQATVAQLSRTLRRYTWAPEADHEEDHDQPQEPEVRRVDFGTTEEGAWRLSALLPVDQGALVERALAVTRQGLVEDEDVQDQPSWADSLVAMADACLGAGATRRPHSDRHLVVVHLRGDGHGPSGHLHLGPPLPDALRRLVGCDTRVRPERGGRGSLERGAHAAHSPRAHPHGGRGARRGLSGAGL